MPDRFFSFLIASVILDFLYMTGCGPFVRVYAFTVIISSPQTEICSTNKIITQQQLSRSTFIPNSSKVTYLSQSSSQANGDSGLSEDDLSINEIYKLAMEEDEDWYQNFVQNVIDVRDSEEDNDKTNDKISTQSRNIPQTDIEGKESDGAQKISNNGEIRETNEEPTYSAKNEDMIVQYRDIFGQMKREPVNGLFDLGYTLSDISILKSDVLDLILEDGMAIPPKGIPKRWVVELDDNGDALNREVKILKRRNKQRKHENESRSSGPRRRRSTFQDNEFASRQTEYQNRYGSQYRSRRIYESGGYDDDDDDNSFWMDVPTFKKYLRQEAKLRLMILGPSWSEWVRNESDWRLNLYQNWMDIMNNGIGEGEVFDDISYAPTGTSVRRSARPERSDRRKRRTRSDPELEDIYDGYLRSDIRENMNPNEDMMANSKNYGPSMRSTRQKLRKDTGDIPEYGERNLKRRNLRTSDDISNDFETKMDSAGNI